MTFAVHTASDPESLTASIRLEILALDRTQPMANIFTMERLFGNSLSRQRFIVLLLGIFSVLALFLSVIGLYGVMSYTVAQSTREIGIRMALGAERRNVVGLIVTMGGRLVLMGLAAGLGGSFLLARVLRSEVFDVPVTDPIAILGVVGLLCATAFVACLVPASRAAKLDPMIALRHE